MERGGRKERNGKEYETYASGFGNPDTGVIPINQRSDEDT
jgi:hypothetical protein